MEPDFSGWATKNDIVCTDGLTIKPGAFQHNDAKRVPLVWQHQHGSVTNILGYAILEHRPEGVFAHAYFNETEDGQHAKQMVLHGDVDSLSIFATRVRKRGDNVVHGEIQEVSLVMAGANEGARITNVYISHGDDVTPVEGELVIMMGEPLQHSASTAESDNEGTDMPDDNENETVSHADDERTIADIFAELTPEQRGAVDYVIVQAVQAVEGTEDSDDDDTVAQSTNLSEGDAVAHSANTDDDSTETVAHANTNQEGTDMHNLFENKSGGDKAATATLSHSQITTIVQDGIKSGSLKDSVIAHAGEYGIDNIDLLFPDAQAVTNQPGILARRTEWVSVVLGGVKHIPFAKVKSVHADLTPEEARAKGYIKGNEKKDEVISLLRRTTSPTTIYKKQKLDRDDILDITSFDVVAWLKWEIRFMLDEEIARAILVGDGRSVSNPDKIKDPMGATDGVGIRSIANDHELYAHQVTLPTNVAAVDVIDHVTRARTAYRGSGSPAYFTTDQALTDLLLLKDKMGRRLYDTDAALASALRVSKIVAVPVLEETPQILGILVNLSDYSVGTNRGGELTFFEDFDIDFNQNKYLMETRLSGALTVAKSAIVIRRDLGNPVTPTAPSFNGETNTITIPTTAGIDYVIDGEVVTGSVEITEATEVVAQAAEGRYIPAGTTTVWVYAYTE